MPRQALRHAASSPLDEALVRVSEVIESRLNKSGVNLTMGGEPTFVPLDPEGDEWITGALGPTKIIYARRLAAAYVRRFAPGALISLHNGKHYPGEPIPRWQLTVQWRRDRTLWTSVERLLIAPPLRIARAKHRAQAQRLMIRLARTLRLLPSVRALREPETTPGRRSPAAAWVLPLRWYGRWRSDAWAPVGRSLLLVEGDSSVGLRLPLNQLPEKMSRTALTVAATNEGGIEIFIPPLEVDEYDRLIAVVEKCVVQEDLRDVVIAGYAPCGAPFGCSLSFSSDPGVLEVNLPPATSWLEHVTEVRRVYEVAAEGGMRAEKFLFNGECHGTGGGAHLCFGGIEPSRSPFITLPHLLPSVIRYWNHHPALSYLFTGQFIGPGCQAPRVDECNPHLIPELELALMSLPKGSWDPVELHRRFIHFFLDASGNTHRAEISLDKLWNPLLPNGRTGIIEFRAIESPPTAHDWAVVALLFQGVIARLASRPFNAPLRRADPDFFDRFLLPSVLEADLVEVLRDLASSGIVIDSALFANHLARRFPELGRLRRSSENGTGNKSGGVSIRQALEVWPLLAELPSGQATSRPVDSSPARIECRLDRAADADSTHLRVNGIPVAFRRFKKRALVGLRFRTFEQAQAFHPHLGTQCPLRIEWVESATGRILDAAVWHHWNPDGEPYPSRPIDHDAAATRRRARWVCAPTSLTSARTRARAVRPATGSGLTEDIRRPRENIING